MPCQCTDFLDLFRREDRFTHTVTARQRAVMEPMQMHGMFATTRAAGWHEPGVRSGQSTSRTAVLAGAGSVPPV
jgi:hypothetical protein